MRLRDLKRIIYGLTLLLTILFLQQCKPKNNSIPQIQKTTIKPNIHFGFDFNKYTVVQDTIKSGDSFGEILQKHHVNYSQVFNIATQAKDSFDVRKIKAGKPYTLLCTNDTLAKATCFIYQPNKIDYVVVNFEDSIEVYKKRRPITIKERTAKGIITNNLSATMDSLGLSYQLINDMSDIYAWTIDFFRLQKGDRFKIVYNEMLLEDSIYAGIERVKASYFEHKDKPFYAFNFTIDSTKNIADYFDENAKSLRRTFLKAPVQFSRISSRYNLNRRIAYYGYKVRPHKGTDFAAPIGTEILATANGTVTESTRRGGNGKYVKIRHSPTYSTQYLHMKKQNVRKGDYVKQGDVIGYVGMTGNTGGPHVCYRFWKNGKQVDPFLEKLPEADSLPTNLLPNFQKFLKPLKIKMDSLTFQSRKMDTLITFNTYGILFNKPHKYPNLG